MKYKKIYNDDVPMKPQDKGAWKLCCMYSVVLDHNEGDADSRWLLGSASFSSESLQWPKYLTSV